MQPKDKIFDVRSQAAALKLHKLLVADRLRQVSNGCR
jgi:hypothetical protein